MNVVDLVIAVPVLWGMYKGFRKGLVLELLTVAGLVAGVIIGLKFNHLFIGFLSSFLSVSSTILTWVSFFLIFVTVVISAVLMGRLLQKMVNYADLGLFNKVFGAATGGLKFALILSVLLLIFDKIDSRIELIDQDRKESSVFYKPVMSIVPTLMPIVKEWIQSPLQHEEPTESSEEEEFI